MVKKTEVASFRLTPEQKAMLKMIGAKELGQLGSVSDGLGYIISLLELCGPTLAGQVEKSLKFMALEIKLKKYEQDTCFWGSPEAKKKLSEMKRNLEEKRKQRYYAEAGEWEKELKDFG